MPHTKEQKREYSAASRAALKKLKRVAAIAGAPMVAGETLWAHLPVDDERGAAPAATDPWHVNVETIRPALAEAERLVRAFIGKFGQGDVSIPVVVTIGSGGKKVEKGRAHASKGRWATREGGVVHEVMLYAEHLNREPVDIAETIMHECVHLHNFTLDVKDTASGGYRHNAEFADAATAMGFDVAKAEGIGYQATLSDRQRTWLRGEFNLEAEAFTLFRTLDPTRQAKPRKSTKAWVCACEGEDRITLRVPAGKLLNAVCGTCSEAFRVKGGEA